MMYRKILAAVVCLSLVALTAFGQQPRISRTAKSPEEQKKEKELEEKALAMLDELIDEAQTLRLPENRVRMLASAASLLWRHDENRARTLFADATQTLTQLIQQPEDSPDALPENHRWQVFNLRHELAQMMVRNDAQLALDFLAATRLPNSAAYSAEQETRIEMMLAQQIARQDPKRALALAKEKLATSKHPGVVGNLIYSLKEKDFALAQELTEIILGKLRAENPLGSESASYAVSMLGLAASPNEHGDASSVRQKHLISPAVARELIERALAAAQSELAKAKGQIESNHRYNAVNLFYSLKNSAPFVERYAPASLSTLKRLLPEADKVKDIHQKRWDDLNELAQKGSPELLIQAAAKAPPDMQYNYFQRASQLAREKGDVERARQIIKDNVSDLNQQRQALREIDQQVMLQHINEGQYDEARQLMAGMRHDWERVNALAQMALHAHNGGKKEIAAALLEEALAIIGGAAESGQMLNSQLLVAGAFVQVNPTRSFDVIESTLDQFNELLAAAAVVESFQQQGSFRQKEMVLNAGGTASQYLPQYGQHLAGLARTDLSRVQSIVNGFTRPEARILVRMFVLQQLLRNRGEVNTLHGMHNFGLRGFHCG